MSNVDVLIANTRKQIFNFEAALADARGRVCPDDVDPVIWQAHIAGLESVLRTLETEDVALSLAKNEHPQNGKTQ